jgi:hypothetical protein
MSAIVFATVVMFRRPTGVAASVENSRPFAQPPGAWLLQIPTALIDSWHRRTDGASLGYAWLQQLTSGLPVIRPESSGVGLVLILNLVNVTWAALDGASGL